MTVNSTRCPHSVLYITSSNPFPITTVDVQAHVSLSVTLPKLVIIFSNWSQAENVKTSCAHGSSCHFVEVSSCNRPVICLCMFKISTSLPFSKAFSVNSKLLCKVHKAASSSSCWLFKDFCLACFSFNVLWTNSSQREFRLAVRFWKNSITSWKVFFEPNSTPLFFSETLSIASLSNPALLFVSERIFNTLSLFFAKASFTNAYLCSRCFTIVQSLQIASLHVSQNSFNNSPSCSLQKLGFFTASDPILLASSSDTRQCSLVLRKRRWAWVQNSQRKQQHVVHLFTGGSSSSQRSHSKLLLPESPWRETMDNKLLRKKLTGRKSTLPSGICVGQKKT